jgi:hypothetical protein
METKDVNQETDEGRVANWLHWRSDSVKTYSDWQIVINENDTYNVHRVVLGAGPQKSGYFDALFQSNMAENQDSTSHIQLEEASAKLVPAMLDFVYTGLLEPIETDMVVVFFSLALYFDIPSLRAKILDFCIDDMLKSEMKEMAFYLSEAEQCPAAGELFDSIITECSREEIFLSIPDDVGNSLKPNWLLAMLEQTSKIDDRANRLVPRCLLTHKDGLATQTAENLIEFVDESIAPQDAVRLLTVLDSLDPEEGFDQAEGYRTFLHETVVFDAVGLVEYLEATAKVEQMACGEENSKENEESSDEGAGGATVDRLDALVKRAHNSSSHWNWTRDWTEAEAAVKRADELLGEWESEEESSWSDDTKHWPDDRQMCINAIIKGWKELCDEDDEEMIDLISNLDGRVLFSLTCEARREVKSLEEK